MSSYIEQLERVRAHIVSKDPWTSGVIDLPEHFTKLYYSDKASSKSAHTLFLSKSATVAELESLASACDPASFGRGGEDVLDETYRKAGKMETTSFCSPFNLHELEVLQRVIPKLFRGPDADKPVFAELYKLNVYGPGSFFRSHKDTPRSNNMFGSLVVVFPTSHQGGSLVLRHKETGYTASATSPGRLVLRPKKKEFTFDSSHLVTYGTNKAAYVAFFSDVEHEVLPVTEGYRITLTYNLYFSGPSGATNPAPTSIDEIIHLKNSISALFNNPTFLPDGGLIGFGLNFSYPITRGGSRRTFDEHITHLKGSDEIIKIACTELGLRVTLKGIMAKQYDEQERSIMKMEKITKHKEDRRVMFSYPVESTTEYEIDDLSLYLIEDWDGELLHTADENPASVHEFHQGEGRYSKEVFWITDSAEYSTFHSKYVTYGNDAALHSFYADVCLIVSVGPAGDRMAPYEGVKIKGPRHS